MADAPRILVLDEGTSSTRAVLYCADGAILGWSSRPIEQHYPAPGLVEHDAQAIWQATLACGRDVIAKTGSEQLVGAIGITNQRETVVAWDRRTGRPLHRAIVWQDRRTADACTELREAGHEGLIQQKTGLLLDPYFSATKLAWLQQRPEIAAAGGAMAFGTIESWLAWKLTGGEHVTDFTNASRTMLLDLEASDWDDDLLELFKIKRQRLPRIVGNAEQLGMSLAEWFGRPIPITALIGDQQSAAVGQGCSAPGQTKLTLGTGAFALTNLGSQRPRNMGRLVGTIASDVKGARSYALEGSIFVAGSLIKWLRDDLGLLTDTGESEALARSVPNNGGVVLLPALAGLGAPYWRPNARAVISGLSFGSTRAHLIRAALEAISHQVVDLSAAFADVGAPWSELRLDGGMSANDWLAQDLASMLGIATIRPADVETTARGAAMLAAVGAGIHPNLAAAQAMLPPTRRFEPLGNAAERDGRMAAWHQLLASSS